MSVWTTISRLKLKMKRLGGSRFLRNVATVATGIVATQIISLAFMPFLTRLYGPEAFGALSAFTALQSLITPLATLGYATAIVLPDTEDGAVAVARLSLVVAALVAPLVLVGIVLFQSQLAVWTGLEASPGVLYLIPISLLLGALLSVANQVAIREDLFRAKTSSHVISTLSTSIGKLGGGLLAPSGLLLILFSLVGSALNIIILLALVPRRGAFFVRRWFGTEGIRRAAREQRDFALYQTPQSIIRAASMGLPIIMLTSLFGASIVGQYSITVLVLSAPVILLGNSVGEVFFPRISIEVRRDPLGAAALLRRATLVMALIAIIPFGIVVAWGHGIFPLVFGEEWARAGEYSQWISIWMISMLMSRPALSAMPSLRLQGALLVYEIFISVARVGALYFGAKIGGDLVAVSVFSMVNVAGYVTLLAFVLFRAGQLRSSP